MLDAKKMLGRTCRDCLNRAAGINLERHNCIYLKHGKTCYYCGQHAHIVRKLRFSGRLKLFFRIR